MRTFAQWDEQRPGFTEMDLVGHCGESTHGEYVQSLRGLDADHDSAFMNADLIA